MVRVITVFKHGAELKSTAIIVKLMLNYISTAAWTSNYRVSYRNYFVGAGIQSHTASRGMVFQEMLLISVASEVLKACVVRFYHAFIYLSYTVVMRANIQY